ncbi:cytochrome c556 [Thioflavicoccus mobilis 8321]|uniref:Cytochrome c556 n=1 Tax=Thioflavicoccus mobilis 8321 TaxID=765912 RepID=L0GX38_9GAMM|nr:cytochrome c [Thioflavicoccus mobilis]AGA91333.1 cytochrome c556 [Thioflavicoccus mobilis 8321]
MQKRLVGATLGIAALALATTAAAQFKPDELIQYRQAGYLFMSWNMGKIKVNLDRDYNEAQVADAANAIAAIANSGMGALFVPGTEHDIGEVKTHVKPAFFENPDDVRELAMDFNQKANELAKVAQNGDPNAVGAAFGEVGKACKACHDKYRAD